MALRSYDLTGGTELEGVMLQNPDFPALIMIKIDVQRRGVYYTERALSRFDPGRHQSRSPYIFGARDAQLSSLPESLLLRDGTSIIVDPTPRELNPYLVDLVDDRLVLADGGKVIEEVEYWAKPVYYDHKTSSGLPMSFVISARPQRLNIFQSGFCHFWANDKGCRFCDIVSHYRQQRSELGIPTRLNPRDVSETLAEALKEPGRFTGICLTAGSNTRGDDTFDRELDYYLETLQAIGKHFS